MCIFIKKSHTTFEIIVVYIDDLNLIGTLEELIKTSKYLKKEFKMNYLGKKNFVSNCRSSIFQIECRFINQQHILRKS